jgi:hypothetical protein
MKKSMQAELGMATAWKRLSRYRAAMERLARGIGGVGCIVLLVGCAAPHVSTASTTLDAAPRAAAPSAPLPTTGVEAPITEQAPPAVAGTKSNADQDAPGDDDALAEDLARGLAELDVTSIPTGGATSDDLVLTHDDVPAGLLDSLLGEPGAPKATKHGPQVKNPETSVSVKGGPVSNVGSIVARMRGRFRQCYQTGLKSEPELEGAVLLVAEVSSNGGATRVTGTASGKLSLIVPCLKTVVAGGNYEVPNGTAATVTIVVTFAKSE